MSNNKNELLRATVRTLSNLLIEELIEILEKEKDRKRRLWVNQWVEERNILAPASTLLLQELRSEDLSGHKINLRISPDKFDELLWRIQSKIEPTHHTHMREPISSKMKLEVTLRYLTTGDSYSSLEFLYRIPRSCICKFLPEVLTAIRDTLLDYMQTPKCEGAWLRIEEGFRTKWNFPTCIGAVNAKYVPLQASDYTTEYFIHEDRNNRIILLGLVDDNYCFNYVDIGCKGPGTEGGVFSNSTLCEAITFNKLRFPLNSTIAGDAAFPLKTYLMKPYSVRSNLTFEQKIFNYRLSRARRVAENAFGIFLSRFRVFLRGQPISNHMADLVILATFSLHNWLRKTSPDYISSCCVDFEDTETGKITLGSWRLQLPEETLHALAIPNVGSNNHSRHASMVREYFNQEFNGRWSVPWQNKMVH